MGAAKIDVENMQAIFVGGLSRSGTTLLQGLLCNSDKTTENSRECSYFRALIEAYQMASTPPYSLHASDYFSSGEELQTFHRKLLGLYFEHYADKFGAGIPVQKEPSLLGFFPEMGELMKKAIFIATVRDPRDILTSQVKKTGEKRRRATGLSNMVSKTIFASGYDD